MKREYELLRKNHAKLQSENEEVRKIVGDMYVSVDEDRCTPLPCMAILGVFPPVYAADCTVARTKVLTWFFHIVRSHS